MLEGAPLWFVIIFCIILALVIIKKIFFRSTVLQLDDGRLVLIQEPRFDNVNNTNNNQINNNQINEQQNLTNPLIVTAVPINE